MPTLSQKTTTFCSVDTPQGNRRTTEVTLQNRSDDLMSGLGTYINDEGRYENTTTWDRMQTKKMEIVVEIKAHCS